MRPRMNSSLTSKAANSSESNTPLYGRYVRNNNKTNATKTELPTVKTESNKMVNGNYVEFPCHLTHSVQLFIVWQAKLLCRSASKDWERVVETQVGQ